ncbi:MAG: hypothetical protein AB8G95_10640 [Anaerolineae bacterium]
MSAEAVGVDAFINGIALRAIVNAGDWSAERQLSELRLYLKRLRSCHFPSRHISLLLNRLPVQILCRC